MNHAVLLDDADNVVVLCGAVRAGEMLSFDGCQIVAPSDVPLGHKLARFDIAEGSKIIKYGAPIGSTTTAIARGAHVHLHNMKSDYISTHSRLAAGGAQQ